MFKVKNMKKKEVVKEMADLLAHLGYLECFESKIHLDPKKYTRVEIFGELDGQHGRICEGVGSTLLEAIQDAFAILRQNSGVDVVGTLKAV